MSDYALITPTNKIVKKFNDLWNTDLKDNELTIEIFKDVDFDISDLKGELIKYGRDDETIKRYLNNRDISNFLKQINSIYHTRVKNISKLNITLDELKELDVDKFVVNYKELLGRNEYSFATKVYSFLYPDKYPIIDSLSATLIWKYLDPDRRKKHPKSQWGKYDCYKNAYDAFKSQYNLDKSYKEIDVFLWTYAILIQNYWENKLGVFKFESIQYQSDMK